MNLDVRYDACARSSHVAQGATRRPVRDAPSLNEGRVPRVSLDAPKDMLTQALRQVALGQLACRVPYEYTPPSRSNARFQARRRAGARYERTLFAVACKPLLGCWRPTQVPGPPGDRLPRPPRAPPSRRMPPRPVGRGRPPGSPMPPVACLALLGHGADVLPCPPPAPAESPHAAPETPPLSWRRTKAPRDHAATLPLVAVPRHQPPTCAVEPARACFHPQPPRCRSLRSPRRPRTPESARAALPARTGSAGGTSDRPTTAADRA